MAKRNAKMGRKGNSNAKEISAVSFDTEFEFTDYRICLCIITHKHKQCFCLCYFLCFCSLFFSLIR